MTTVLTCYTNMIHITGSTANCTKIYHFLQEMNQM